MRLEFETFPSRRRRRRRRRSISVSFLFFSNVGFVSVRSKKTPTRARADFNFPPKRFIQILSQGGGFRGTRLLQKKVDFKQKMLQHSFDFSEQLQEKSLKLFLLQGFIRCKHDLRWYHFSQTKASVA